MSEFGSGFNLPPGCYESDLPGNSEIEMAAERAIDAIGVEEMREFCESEYVGDVIYPNDNEVWMYEGDEGEIVAPFASKEIAVEKFIDEREEFILDAMTERVYERMADGDY